MRNAHHSPRSDRRTVTLAAMLLLAGLLGMLPPLQANAGDSAPIEDVSQWLTPAALDVAPSAGPTPQTLRPGIGILALLPGAPLLYALVYVVRRLRKQWLFCLLLPWFGAASLSGAAPEEHRFLWDRAHVEMTVARAPDDFLVPAATYRDLLAADVRNGHLFYNLGTAWLLAGDPRQALQALERAERYDGARPDLRRNMRIARRALGASPDGKRPPWQRWLLFWHFVLGTRLRITMAVWAYAGVWAALGWRLVRRTPRAEGALVVCLILMLLFGLSAAASLLAEQAARRIDKDGWQTGSHSHDGFPTPSSPGAERVGVLFGAERVSVLFGAERVSVLFGAERVSVLFGAERVSVPESAFWPRNPNGFRSERSQKPNRWQTGPATRPPTSGLHIPHVDAGVLPHPLAPPAERASITARLETDRADPYCFQEFTLTLTLRATGPRLGQHFQIEGLPAPDVLLRTPFHELPAERRTEGGSEVEIRRYRSTGRALSSGPLVVRADLLVAVLDPEADTAQGEREIVHRIPAEPLHLTIRPLPTHARPSDFSGAVGRFSLRADVVPQQGAAGALFHLRTRLEGHGYLRDVTPPALRHAPGCRLGTPRAVPSARSSGLAFEQRIVPQGSAVSGLPAVTFSYFDPETGSYETLTEGPFALRPMSLPRTARFAPSLLAQPLFRWPGKAEPQILDRNADWLKVQVDQGIGWIPRKLTQP